MIAASWSILVEDTTITKLSMLRLLLIVKQYILLAVALPPQAFPLMKKLIVLLSPLQR